MRIAYHNPWINSSENQGYMSMAEAGRRIGVELVACGDAAAIEACRPDFVLSVASSMAKITDYPSYLTVHEPKAYLLEQPNRFRNLFSYDGYLTISDSLERFIKDICHGLGRSEQPGFCYLTPQVNARRSDWGRADRADTLRVVYFGTNWNRRMPALFRALDPSGVLRIHGPDGAWRAEGYASYAGPVAFDGEGPQRIYAECGIGLALMDERWQREDVISNRVFEISSVGAVSICPDMPWTRKWFGDSVLYFDPDRPMREIAAQIIAHHGFCRANPDVAGAMGERAREIFEAHFSAERMLANAVDYHHRRTAERAARRASLPPAPRITVVLRCGGRPVEMVRRALESVRRQSYGRFTVILARYRDLDLAALTAEPRGAVEAYDSLLIEGGGRAQMLFAAIERIATPYFAVLDDDDFWLSDHVEELFRAGTRVRADFDMAFSGAVDFDFPVHYTPTQTCDRNIARFGFEPVIADGVDIQNAIGTNCFVARTDLLRPEMGVPSDMRTAEDSLLICLLAWRSKPIFSYRPTAFYRRDAADGSNWRTDAQRSEDEISFALRAGLAWSPSWLGSGSLAVPRRVWATAKGTLGSSRMGEQLDRLTVGAAGQRIGQSVAARPGAVGHVCYGPYVTLAPGRYLVIFMIAPDEDAGPFPPDRAIGAVDVAAGGGERILGQQNFGPGQLEVALVFTIDAATTDALIEFRAFSYGLLGFSVESVALHADRGDAAAAVAPARRVHAPDPQELVIEKLEAKIADLHRSTSWRMTAPLRLVADLVRGRAGQRG